MTVRKDTRGTPGTGSWRVLRRDPRRLAAFILVVLALLGFLVWNQGQERRALSRMPSDERAELYSRALADLEVLCSDARQTALVHECRRRARFLLKFPECDGKCRALAEQQLER
ncbi:MAG: hypothetical protein L0Y66_19785 [Myxococcaceae bacterium]|nr:hypothetical protein [Myxococcaceae bacterium]